MWETTIENTPPPKDPVQPAPLPPAPDIPDDWDLD